jgi:PPK2 family polyphosphate:nucleotide phosphotransferase
MPGMKELATRYRITDGEAFHLADIDPGDRGGIRSKQKAAAALATGIERLADLQGKLYAQDRWALLVVLQAMDAAGKDGTIKHVMSGVNPQGCEVTSFKVPSTEELDHDFLWRCSWRLPGRGRIGIFNRSYYEEVLVVRVHPELLERQHLSPELVGPKIWKERYEDINAFERRLARNGTRVLKFFLHVSRDEQRRRFMERLDTPDKHWKFSPADVAERQHWDAYMAAAEEMIRHTATPFAPWHVVPADHKWFTHLVVGETIVAALEDLHPVFPTVDKERGKELKKARAALAQDA